MSHSRSYNSTSSWSLQWQDSFGALKANRFRRTWSKVAAVTMANYRYRWHQLADLHLKFPKAANKKGISSRLHSTPNASHKHIPLYSIHRSCFKIWPGMLRSSKNPCRMKKDRPAWAVGAIQIYIYIYLGSGKGHARSNCHFANSKALTVNASIQHFFQLATLQQGKTMRTTWYAHR